MSERGSSRIYTVDGLYDDLWEQWPDKTIAEETAPEVPLLDFAKRMYRGFQTGRHHRKIAEALEAVERGEIRRLMISVPPRHGKSLLTSTIFPAWDLGRNPNHRIIATSYSADLSHDFSRKVRNMLDTEEFREVFPRVHLAPDARAVGAWELAKPYRGGYVSAGVGGSITGKGADIALIDDPIKDAEEAASATVLAKVSDWYRSTLYTRLQGDGAVILIMTRWSEGDLAGVLLDDMANDAEADQWTVLRLPAFAEENDPLGRAIDEPLWPEVYDAGKLRRRQVTLGARAFAALYQQRPSPAGGAVFKRDWWKRYSIFDRTQATQVIQVWDTAFGIKETNDYSVCATWAMAPTGAYLLDVFRERVEFPELKRKAKDLYARWRPALVLIENKASGQSLIQELAHETLIPLLAASADKDKLVRAHAVTPYIEGGRAFLPESAPWVDEFIEEHAAFNNGAHDDQVDTTSIALKRLFIDDPTFRDEDVQAAIHPDLPIDQDLFA